MGERVTFTANGSATSGYLARPEKPGPGVAGKLMMSLRVDVAARDLAAAINYLTALPGVTGPSVGTIGFCMGGAGVVFYGIHPNIKPDLPSLRAPVLGIFAAQDGMVIPEVVADLDRRLTELGKPHAFHAYPDTRHAFFNEDRADVYAPAAAAHAWAKTLAFLRRELH